MKTIAENEPDLALPCPACEYDLRGQVNPYCPECGLHFESMEALTRQVRDGDLICRRVFRWRQSVAWIMAGSFFVTMLVGILPIFLPKRLTDVLRLTFLLLPVGSGLAFAVMLKVVQLRADHSFSRTRRKELHGSIFILLLLSIPFILTCLFLFGLLLFLL